MIGCRASRHVQQKLTAGLTGLAGLEVTRRLPPVRHRHGPGRGRASPDHHELPGRHIVRWLLPAGDDPDLRPPLPSRVTGRPLPPAVGARIGLLRAAAPFSVWPGAPPGRPRRRTASSSRSRQPVTWSSKPPTSPRQPTWSASSANGSRQASPPEAAARQHPQGEIADLRPHRTPRRRQARHQPRRHRPHCHHRRPSTGVARRLPRRPAHHSGRPPQTTRPGPTPRGP